MNNVSPPLSSIQLFLLFSLNHPPDLRQAITPIPSALPTSAKTTLLFCPPERVLMGWSAVSPLMPKRPSCARSSCGLSSGKIRWKYSSADSGRERLSTKF